MMKEITVIFSIVLFSAVSAEEKIIWQLGMPDSSNSEFIRVDNREFRTNPVIRYSPDYCPEKEHFIYRIPEKNGVFSKVKMPGGISGAGAGNYSTVRSQTIVWNEKLPGIRQFELSVIPHPNARNFQQHRIQPNENMDIDGMTYVPGEIVVKTSGKRLIRAVLPYDLKYQLEQSKRSSLNLCVVFPVESGENRIEILENSGNTYGRIYAFDFLRLTLAERLITPPPTIEFHGHVNFLNSSVYEAGTAAEVGLDVFHLPPGKVTTGNGAFVDFWGKTYPFIFRVIGDRFGFAHATVPVPPRLSGVFVVNAGLPGGISRSFRIAGIRIMEPLGAKEMDLHFMGLCGLSCGMYFDPSEAKSYYLRRAEEYRKWRRLLQVRHERIHSLCWHFVEKREGKYDWDIWDRIMAGEKADRIDVQLGLLGTPKFLIDRYLPGKKYNHPSEYYFSPPPDMKKWEEFCKRTAERYGDYVKEFELWNEPSEQSLFWYKGNQSQLFDLIRYGSRGIKSARPDAKVVVETLWARQEEFCRAMFERGINKYVDIHADHYLSDERIHADRKLADRYAPGAPIISNENKCEQSGNPLGQVDDATRRRAANSLIRNMLYANAHGFKRIYNFMLTGNTWRMWGMVGPDGTVKPTFGTFKTLFNRMTGAKFVRYIPLSDTFELFVYSYESPRRERSNGGRYIAVLTNNSCNGKKEKITLPVEAAAYTLIDVMDNAKIIPAENRIAELELEDSPLFLVGLDLAALDRIAAVKIVPENLNLRSGDSLTLNFIPETNAYPGTFSITAGTFRTRIALKNSPLTVKIPMDKSVSNMLGIMKVSGVIHSPERDLPLTRYFNYCVEDQVPGCSLLPPLSDSAWRKWGGKIELRYQKNSVNMAINAPGGVGAISMRREVNVIPHARYLLNFQAAGAGVLRVMFNGFDRQGKSRVLNHNILSENLSAGFRNYQKIWTAPPDVTKLNLSIYEYKSIGNIQLRNLRLIRLLDNIPVNRQLFAVEVLPVADSTSFPAFRNSDFVEVSDAPLYPILVENPLSAAFAAGYGRNRLFFCVRVKDKYPVSGPSEEGLWNGDSVQLDFDLSPGLRKNRTVQFGFADFNGRPVCYRYSILPAEDIVPTYRIGKSPEGVTCDVRRLGEETVYRIMLNAEAIHPQLRFTPGKEIGFSLLVNNNDGKGRKQYLQWSSGIGQYQDSTQFGVLRFREGKTSEASVSSPRLGKIVCNGSSL